MAVGTTFLTIAYEAHRSCSKVTVALFGYVGSRTTVGVVAENCRRNPCLLGWSVRWYVAVVHSQ
ncbi:hypothetical protein AHAS_Ahas18G0115400 [Arachis hypogaea]